MKHEKTYASLEAGDEVFDIGINRAVTLIAEKIAKGPSRRFGADPGKAIGDHPTLGTVTVKGGRYGAYVTAGGVNATIPSDIEKDAITLPQAIALIDERAAKGGGKKPKKTAKPAKAKAKKAAGGDDAAPKTKKPAAKKAAKPKSESTSKARAAVSSSAKTSAIKTSPTKAAGAKAPAKKSAGTN
ncbi:topoisomerase IA-like protein [Bradyrhizobium sp. LM4.3]